jgi:hypothetical protein
MVVEAAFGLRSGFWGRVDAGVDPGRLNAMANKLGGKDKYAASARSREIRRRGGARGGAVVRSRVDG